MKFKQLCILATISMLTLTGCSEKSSDVANLNKEIDQLKEEITVLQKTINEKETTVEPESNEDSTNSNTDVTTRENENYTANQVIFEDILNSSAIKAAIEKNSQQSKKEIFNIYGHEDDSDVENYKFKVSNTIEIGVDLELEEKANILCKALKEEMKDIEIIVDSTIDNKVATIIAVEKYPQWGSITPGLRRSSIEKTLSQLEYTGEWYEYVTVIYDSGTGGDI